MCCKKKMEMLKSLIANLLGLDKFDYRIRQLERKNYWREKYKHVISERKSTTNILQN